MSRASAARTGLAATTLRGVGDDRDPPGPPGDLRGRPPVDVDGAPARPPAEADDLNPTTGGPA